MELLHLLKAIYRHKIERKYPKAIERRQFNITCSQDIIVGVKFIAAILEVPYYVIAEHMLQVGSYHILKAAKDPQQREKLVEHLVKVHLLGDELTDDEDILTLAGKNWT
jgi:hypothetical protein